MSEETRPTERAMKAAVEMEIHAAVSSSTLAKGAAIDKYFSGYDDLLAALKRIVEHQAAYIDELPGAFGVGDLEAARAAIAKAEGPTP